MIRTVWLAIICLALVSALAAGKALRTPADPVIADLSADRMTVGIGLDPDTLRKADRLEINYVRHVIQAEPALQATEPAAPAVAPPERPMDTRIISRHWRDPNALSSLPKDSHRAEPRKNKSVDRKRNQAADRSKPTEPLKPCRRLGPFGDLLRAVNLSPACAS